MVESTVLFFLSLPSACPTKVSISDSNPRSLVISSITLVSLAFGLALFKNVSSL